MVNFRLHLTMALLLLILSPTTEASATVSETLKSFLAEHKVLTDKVIAAQKELKECEEKNDVRKCLKAASQFVSLKAIGMASRAYKKSCALSTDNCELLAHFAHSSFDTQVISDVLSFLKNSCENNINACDSLAILYGHEGQGEQAIEFSKRYFDIGKKGAYPLIEFNHGNKKVAYQAMLESCLANHSHCSSYLLNYQHPEAEKFLKFVADECRKGIEVACIRIGFYVFHRKDYKSAASYWSQACELKNESSCLNVIALKNVSIKEKLNIFALLCEIPDAVSKYSECAAVKGAKAIPTSLLNTAKDSFETDLRFYFL